MLPQRGQDNVGTLSADPDGQDRRFIVTQGIRTIVLFLS